MDGRGVSRIFEAEITNRKNRSSQKHGRAESRKHKGISRVSVLPRFRDYFSGFLASEFIQIRVMLDVSALAECVDAMRRFLRRIFFGVGCFVAIGAAGICAEEPGTVSIAAAANLTHVAKLLNAEFATVAPNVKVTISFAASGSLFAQISHGAPFDLFMSADTAYPRRLTEEGHADPASLRTFAVGRLALWTTRSEIDVSDLGAALASPRLKKLAIAQPRVAPYGHAAEEVTRRLKLWDHLAPKLVYGENITQTAQFVQTGNADAGFVALSFLAGNEVKGHWCEVPKAWYASVSLEQACVLTHRGAQNPAARRYLEFLQSEAARKILEAHGYAAPSG